MKRFTWAAPLLAAVVGLGCSGSGGKPGCGGAGSCGAGNYCAHTPDGNVCWPDDVAPSVSSVVVTCSTDPCRRDATLHVTADASDNAVLASVAVALDVDAAHPKPLAHGAGTTWEADLPLTSVDFPYFEHGVTATVTATDEAGHSTQSPASAELRVTRLAWTRTLKGATALSLFSPAVLPEDGRVVLAGSDGRLYFVSKDGQTADPVPVSASGLSGPPAIAARTAWVGSQDGSLYSVASDGNGSHSCVAGAPLIGAPAVASSRVVASSSLGMVVADTAGLCSLTDAAPTAEPVLGGGGLVFVPAAGVLRSFSIRPTGALRDEWAPTSTSPSVGDVYVGPPVDSLGAIWTTSATGSVARTTTEGTTTPLSVTVSAGSTGAVVLSDGTALFGDRSAALLRRLSTTGTGGWTSATLTGSPTAPLALAGETPSVLVATSRGYVFLLDQSDGSVIWFGRLTASNQSLETPNIWTEPGASTSTAYLAGADGILYAVIVDGALDTSAPWPKAYHDPQNTSNAGYVP